MSSISQKLEKSYKNQIELIKNEKNWKNKIKLVGALCMDVGERCVSAIAKICECSREYISKCYNIAINKLEIISNKNKCGRKKKIDEYLELKDDIKNIMENNTYCDPHFETEIQFCSLTIDEVMNKLISLNKYPDKFISRSCLATLLNKLGYNLKKVKRSKPLKKIAETDLIFENVNKKKKEAMDDDKTALISIDNAIIAPFLHLKGYLK